MRRLFAHLMAVLFVSYGYSFAADSDGDGLDDSVETNTGVYVDENNTGTDPNNPDTDGDGWYDQYEMKTGFSALNALNFPNHQTFKEINFEEYEIHKGIGSSSEWQRIQTTTSSEGTLHTYLNGELSSGSISLVYSSNDGGKWRWPQSPRTNIGCRKSQAIPGGFIVSGYLMGNHQFGSFNLSSANETDPWVGFISTEGVWQWVKKIPTSAWSSTWDHCIDAEGNIYVTGYIYGSVTIAGTSIGGAGWYDAFLASLSPDGDWRWATSLGGNSSDFGRSVRISNTGDLLWKGDFRSGASIQGENLNFVGGGSISGAGDLFSALISSTDGTVQQVTTYGTDSSEHFSPNSNIEDLLLSWHSSSYSIGSSSGSGGSDLLVASKYNTQNGEALGSVTIATDVSGTNADSSVPLASKSAGLDYFFVRKDQTTDLVITDEDSVVYRRDDLELGGFVFLSAYNDSSDVPHLILTGKNDDDLGVNTTDILDVAIGEPIPQFQVIEGNFTWDEAKADAEAKGGRLAVLDTQEKIDSISDQLESFDGSLWIGLTDEVNEGDWKWVNGEALTVNNWKPEQPSGFGGENYGHIYWKTRDAERRWNDARGDDPNIGPGVGGLNNEKGYLLEIIPQNPAPPLVQLGALYESPSGEAIVIDATPAAGFPAEFTYQWCFNGFKIPANLGGTASSITIDNLQSNEGTWSVTVTNEIGSVEQSFEYRVYADTDSDGLSDAYEELVSLTDINNSDTDNDGLADGDEVNTYSTNPNSSDSDSDGFTDLYELETAYDPNSAESTPDAQVNIMTAIEVDFNAALGATYEIQFSTDTIEWTVIEAGIVGEGNAVERLYSRKDFPTGFFRVERTDQ
ncbi:hypothetical protein N8574_01800 [Akkermansiaceae bacterium]|nr:hypothetical protein [Akkermansiaceae bacterium]